MAKVQLTPGRRLVKKDTKPNPVKRAASSPVKSLTGLSLRQLMKATPPYIRSNAEDVVIKSLKRATTVGGLPAIRARTTTLGKKTGNVYETNVIGKEKDIPLSKQKHVLVSCTCDFFWSHCEYALHHWGSAVIKYSNGQPAVVTNPANQPLLCKHAYKLAETILKESL